MIIRSESESRNFTVVSNELIRNENISWKAKGILTYLLGCPRDWIVRVADLVNRSPDGKHAVYSALRELRDNGYARIKYIRSKDGKHLVGKEWVVYDKRRKPVEAETCNTGNQHYRKPVTQKTATHTNTNLLQKQKSNTNKECAAGAARGSFDMLGINGHSTKPRHLKAVELTHLFYKGLAKNNWHLGRQDLPKGESPQTKKRRKATFHSWCESFEGLLLRQAFDRVETHLEWYFDHCHDKYSGTYKCARTFCEAFEKIEKARHRDRQTEPLSLEREKALEAAFQENVAEAKMRYGSRPQFAEA